MERCRRLLRKYREMAAYIVCGCLTTLVNIVIYWFCTDVCGIFYLLANAIAWIASVLFAYMTNRTWVFKSKKTGVSAILMEFLLFVGGRLLSFAGDTLIMFACVSVIGMPGLAAKIFSNVFVVVFNYVFSKLIIFRKG